MVFYYIYFGNISANNLREVEIKFNKAVDRVSAETKELYSVVKAITGFTPEVIKSAKLLDDNKTVILTMNSNLDNQVKYNASVLGVKAAGVAFTQKDIQFTVLDAAAPHVEAIQALGKKAIKVIFSEPVNISTSVSASTYFMIDGKVASGTLSVSGREVTIKLFTELAVGTHQLTVNKSVVDYNGYQTIIETKDFEVIADATAPSIKEIKNVTFEGATLVFDEDVDPTTVKATNIYWKDGEIVRRAASVTKLTNSTYQLVFSGVAKLPVYETELFVTGVKDYAGNAIAANASIKVKAVIDEGRPEVISDLFNNTTAKSITFKFNKTIDYTTFKAVNFVIKDEDGKVVPNVYTIPSGNTKDLVINFANALSKGEYTFTLLGIKDTTTLANTMLPYTGTISVVSTTAPTVTSTVNGRTIILNFSQAMDLSTTASVLNPDNYWSTYKVGTTTITGKLPEQTTFEVLASQKTILITVPNGVTLVSLTVQGVKSADGVVLAGYAKEVYTTATNTFNFVSAKSSSNYSVVVKLNQPVIEVNPSDFAIVDAASPAFTKTPDNATISSSDNTMVTLSWDDPVIPSDLKANNNRLRVKINSSATTKSISGAALAPIAYGDVTNKNIIDNITPSIVTNEDGEIEIKSNTGNDITKGIAFDRAAHKIYVNFTENVIAKNPAVAGTYFTITNSYGTKLGYGEDYTTIINNSAVEITLIPAGENVAGYDGVYFIEFNNAEGYIKDTNADADWNTAGTTLVKPADNFNTATDCVDYAESIKLTLDYKAPSVVSATVKSATEIVLVFDEEIETAFTADNANGFAVSEGTASITKAEIATDKKTVTITGADFVAGTTKYAYTPGTLADKVGNLVEEIASTLIK